MVWREFKIISYHPITLQCYRKLPFYLSLSPYHFTITISLRNEYGYSLPYFLVLLTGPVFLSHKVNESISEE